MNSLVKFIIERFFVVFGISWTIIEILDHFSSRIASISNHWWVFAGILFAGFVSVWNAFRNNQYKINSLDEYIGFKYGNLLKQKGIVVIPVNAEFDTIVGHGIVSKKTIHGQFINKFYKNNPENLAGIIENQLRDISYEPLSDTRRGNRKRYPIGTCIKCKEGETTFVLLSISEFDENSIARSDISKINVALSSLWVWINQNAEIGNVHLPIIGNGLSRTNETKGELIKSIIGSGLAAINESRAFTHFNIIVPYYSIRNIEEHFEFNEYMKYSAKYLSGTAVVNQSQAQLPNGASTLE